jgi:hypothetical protein
LFEPVKGDFHWKKQSKRLEQTSQCCRCHFGIASLKRSDDTSDYGTSDKQTFSLSATYHST